MSGSRPDSRRRTALPLGDGDPQACLGASNDPGRPPAGKQAAGDEISALQREARPAAGGSQGHSPTPGRYEQAETNASRPSWIEAYLPAQLSDEELADRELAIAETGATEQKTHGPGDGSS